MSMSVLKNYVLNMSFNHDGQLNVNRHYSGRFYIFINRPKPISRLIFTQYFV